MLSHGDLGTTMGFFLQWTGPDWYYGGWRSIEHEIVPTVNPPVSLDLSWSNGTDRLQKHTQAKDFNPAGWHNYEIEWTPDYVSLSVDGTEYQRTEKGHPGVDM